MSPSGSSITINVTLGHVEETMFPHIPSLSFFSILWSLKSVTWGIKKSLQLWTAPLQHCFWRQRIWVLSNQSCSWLDSDFIFAPLPTKAANYTIWFTTLAGNHSLNNLSPATVNCLIQQFVTWKTLTLPRLCGNVMASQPTLPINLPPPKKNKALIAGLLKTHRLPFQPWQQTWFTLKYPRLEKRRNIDPKRQFWGSSRFCFGTVIRPAEWNAGENTGVFLTKPNIQLFPEALTAKDCRSSSPRLGSRWEDKKFPMGPSMGRVCIGIPIHECLISMVNVEM